MGERHDEKYACVLFSWGDNTLRTSLTLYVPPSYRHQKDRCTSIDFRSSRDPARSDAGRGRRCSSAGSYLSAGREQRRRCVGGAGAARPDRLCEPFRAIGGAREREAVRTLQNPTRGKILSPINLTNKNGFIPDAPSFDAWPIPQFASFFLFYFFSFSNLLKVYSTYADVTHE
ncbi:hypothetical protein EVAR_79485_1 [Eumeta japonica]|uniref:Uncharacterized protein n=1 Tax=Eumeta variegata TaxID=151549 RepID=A0A4C1UF48_EUMVA|nr:hypothetical protein EVAR_79485_1 [Eumeta japonica]